MRTSKSKAAVAAATTTVLAVALLGTPSQAAPSVGPTVGRAPSGAESAGRDAGGSERAGFFDERQVGVKAALRSERNRLSGQSKGVRAYERSLGTEALVDYDPLTATVRNLARRDGYLTDPASGSARSIALSFVRSHLDTVGLTPADLSTLTFRKEYVDPLGVRHLSWTQSVNGVKVFGNGLKVKVTRDGRVLSVQGAPVSGLVAKTASASGSSAVDAAEARAKAAGDVGGAVASDARVTSAQGAETRWSNDDYAEKVWFLTPTGLRLGWSTYVQAGGDLSYQHVVDAATGRVLFRRSTVNHKDGEGRVYDYYPGAPDGGGNVKTVNFIKKGWVKANKKWLNGSTVIAWADFNDDNAPADNETTPMPGNSKRAQFKLNPFGKSADPKCKTFVCTWHPHQKRSWLENMKADVTQGFYLANNFHDYLAKGPIGFDRAAGNFSKADGDPVFLNTLDGANARKGMPDFDHVDNANMNTPPDGSPPLMQMYLWHEAGVDESPFIAASSAFDAATLYHEYVHGLSNRLVVDADGVSTLNSLQAGAMGEAWSDFYALDYITERGWETDTEAPGEIKDAEYITGGGVLRTQALDCPVDATSGEFCQDRFGEFGGYTYGDLSNIIASGAQVHASAEIWTQTLWDIRQAFGHEVVATLATRAMSLSAGDPSMLDMRNAVLQADQVAYEGSHTDELWDIFATRGLGYYAGSTDSADVNPAEDFEPMPPADTPKDSIAGTVTDPVSGDPVEGALVQVTGQGDAASAVTDANGDYSIDNLFRGTYQKVIASAPGYEVVSKAVDTTAPADADFEIRRDWAAAAGGGAIDDFNGPDYGPECGPEGAIDLSQGTGWGSTTGNDNGAPAEDFIPKWIIVELPEDVDISTFEVDPSSTCGDPASASTGDFKIETSPDGEAWTEAATGAFDGEDLSQYNEVVPTGGTDGVRFVRFTILGNQVPDFEADCPDGPFAGCSYTDLTELMVFGSPTPTP